MVILYECYPISVQRWMRVYNRTSMLAENTSEVMEDFCGKKFAVFDSSVAAFSDCFESLVFAFLPFTLLALTSAFYVGRLRIPDLRIKIPRNHKIRLICTMVTLILTVTNDLITIFARNGGQAYLTICFSVTTLGLLIHLIYLWRLKEVYFIRGHGPGPVIFSWVLTLPHFILKAEYFTAKAVNSSSAEDEHLIELEAAFAILSCVSQTIYLCCLFASNHRFRTILIDDIDDTPPHDGESILESDSRSYDQVSVQTDIETDKRSPSDNANPLSKLFFSWVQPLMKKGADRQLTNPEAVYDLPNDINTCDLDTKFLNYLKEVDVEENIGGVMDEKNILLKVMHKSFGTIYYASGVLKLLADALGFAGPLLLNKLVNYIENKDEPARNGYYYATGLFLSTLIGALLSAHFDFQVNKVKLRAKSALMTNIYRKTLQAQPTELSSYTIGEITNFMSTDVDRVVNFSASFHEFWSLPFQVAVTLFLLYQQVGIVFLTGLGIAIVMILFNHYLANKIGKYNADMMKEKDSRVKLMTEILLGIRVVKFNAWEYIMSEKLGRIRNEEVKNLKGIKYFDAGCVYLWATTPVLISLLTFSVYSAIGQELTAAKVFTVIALINMLISPLNAFPWVVNGLMEAWISLKRLNKFIRIKDLVLEKYYDFPQTIESDEMDVVVDVQKGNFVWSAEQGNVSESGDDFSPQGKDQSLNDISLTIREGQFIGVIGTVGSGKSSLLAALLAEMKREDGKIYVECVNHGFAVVPQEPWIEHATIRDNITWGLPYDAHRYESVIACCALREDLQMFADSDLTEVGERGVTLSGGQKARVALARAVYQDKSLYLLDDPLSAVDQHVASHLHDRCIVGTLTQKTRILCTHHTKYLRHADAVVVMDNGRIKDIGTPSEILQLTAINDDEKKISTVKMNIATNSLQSEEISSDNDSSNKLMTEEEKAVGTVAFSVYRSYWFAIGTCLATSTLLFLFLMQGSKVTSDWWLSYWVSNIKGNDSSSLYYTHSLTEFNSIASLNASKAFYQLHFVQPIALPVASYTTLLTGFDSVDGMSEDVRWYLMIYGCIAAGNSIFTLLRSFLFAYGGIKAALVLHTALLKGVLQAPISFFDVTPVGRILNRFSSDTYTVDDSLPFILNIFLAQFVGVIGTVVITCYGLPWFSFALIPLGIFYVYVQHYYRLTSRELKRLSSISLSPIYAHFTETLSGLMTVRAFRKHEMFRCKNVELVTTNQRCNFSALAAQEWFGIRLQMIGVAMVTVVAFVAVFMHGSDSVSPGLAGLALSYALSVTSRLSGVLTSFTETEKQMVAVERESYYINNIPKERETDEIDPRIITFWPVQGTVEFSEVSLRYREGLPLALDRVSFRIETGEKIGIVGRTGSGKSSLLMLLFGMIEPSDGSILIDEVNIKTVPLKTLRSKLSIIPQDPFLFSGSLRENLVPTECDTYTDAHLLHVLERCNLKDKVIEMGGLYTDVGERGKRLSVGQRQLLCLARALLTDTKIVCLDEATASVDGESDAILQQTIRQQFKDRTVLTIAHRIDTIMDCDRVIVLNDGVVSEFGRPDSLLTDSNSLFYKLSRRSGPLNT